MASPYQQQSVQRKLIYFGIVLVLLTVTIVLRNPGLLGNSSLEAQADNLSMREQNLGEVDLPGSALRLTLTGSRGLTVCAMWLWAQQNQKKHEWNKLDLLVRYITKLQPHFTTPWLFQSWNLAYNVSVESDRVGDKYFYITRGIELLAEGERQNKDNPDMRSNLGYYYQDKIGMADEHNTLRSLYQLSLIDPIERNPERFRSRGSKSIDNWDEFERFCREHPMLVRRLRETPGKKPDEVICKTPDEVVDFLKDNQKVPSRFEDVTKIPGQLSSPLKPVKDRFPVLPDKSGHGGGQEITYETPTAELGDAFDNFATARAWFSYAQDPLEPPLNRAPKAPMKVIFQGFPSRAQYYVAEFREKEGWFDKDGWEIKDWFPADKNQPEGPKRSLTVGAGQPWAVREWSKAYDMVKERGDRCGLNYKPSEVERLPDRLKRDYYMGMTITNHQHFLVTSRVERTERAVTARKLFSYADRFAAVGDYDQALPFYEKPEAFGPSSTWNNSQATGWRRVLLDNPDYAQEDEVQEDSYVFQHQYKRAVQEQNGVFLKQLVVLGDCFAQATQRPPGVTVWLPPPQVTRRLHAQLVGPLDDRDKDGKPFIAAENVSTARHRLGLFDFAAAAMVPNLKQTAQMQQRMKTQAEQRRTKRMGN